jgi:hypothetical protein
MRSDLSICIYSLSDMIRMIMHNRNWTYGRLAIEIGTSERYLYDLRNEPEGSFQKIPKGAAEIARLFREIFPNPIPLDLRHLSNAAEKIQWLRRRKNQPKHRQALIVEVNHWVATFCSFETSAQASNIETFVYSNLEGHAFFVLAFDLSPTDFEEGSPVARISKQRALTRASDAFGRALRHIDREARSTKRRYEYLSALAAFNIGAAKFMAYKAKPHGEGLAHVKELFEGGDVDVVAACEFFNRVDPLDARVPYNMCCWFSVTEMFDPCALWYERLLHADKGFANLGYCPSWMSRPMSRDPDFRYLVKNFARISNRPIKEAA